MDKNEILARAKEYINEEKDQHFRQEVEELIKAENMAELEDRFYQNLEFGTGGLRGIIGGGTNRMNTWMINHATQGLANYFIKTFPEKAKAGTLSAVIAYDSRRFSDVFAEATALIFAANGFKTYLFTSLRPTPELSFAIRTLGCDTGVVVTASHNPPQYNGYKAYWNDGAQVIEPHDTGIIDEVNAVSTIKTISKEEALASGKLIMIDKEVDEKYWEMCKAQLFRPDVIKAKASEAKIVYTPLHGTGAMHVEKVLSDLGLTVITVPEQRIPDGNFPTVEKPNPEEAPALKMAVELAEKEKADVVMATDPDADRFGIAVPDANGKYVLITGNQMGALLTDYIIVSRKELGKMPANPAIVRSIVTSPFADKICAANGVKLVECLTGFKWIANVMAGFEKTNSNNYIFGFEESYGYNVETDVRDKDGVSAAAMCAEMTLYWRTQGKSLLQRLEELYTTYGYFQDSAISQNFPGASGGQTMKNIMTKLRTEGLKSLGGKTVLSIRDVGESVVYNPANPDKKEKLDLPKSNVIQFFLDGGTVVSARPSGTEPKIKFYINCVIENSSDLAKAKEEADKLTAAIDKEIKEVLDSVK
ncbi:MAG: phospho-sugar mutase [Spirochaetaceae bacterium]|mgnify:FL=1|nr:phospho-sugar mutase [Spirochaetaceae bacterium]MBP3450787.1 phospho-sugar mutase [Spirochaetaceae bacterium]MBQ3023916.1 phospho-sugar mutase [Spirochaetaceae bacterium]